MYTAVVGDLQSDGLETVSGVTAVAAEASQQTVRGGHIMDEKIKNKRGYPFPRTTSYAPDDFPVFSAAIL